MYTDRFYDVRVIIVLLVNYNYRTYSNKCPGHLLNFGTLRVGAYSRWVLIRRWALIIFSSFSAGEDIFRE